MDDINLFSIMYIAFRLAPFILVSFFSILSIINQDVKGIIYLGGLLIAIAVSVFVGNSFKSYFTNPTDAVDNLYESTTRVCNLMTLSKSGPLSMIPLSMVIFSFTFFYLYYGMQFVANNVSTNIPTMIIFPLIIVADAVWHLVNKCNNAYAILASFAVGGGVGLMWGYILHKSKSTGLLYFNGLSTSEVCNRPTQQTFKCQIRSTTKSK